MRGSHEMKVFVENFFQRKTYRKLMLVGFDFLCVVVSSFLALLIRFDFQFHHINEEYIMTMLRYLPISMVITHIIFVLFKLYKSLWIFAGLIESINIFIAVGLSASLQMIIIELLGWPIPRSFYLLYFVFMFIFVVVGRFSYRLIRKFYRQETPVVKEKKNTLIIGAGDACNTILKELRLSKHLNRKIVGIIDDDPLKKDNYMQQIKIFGGRDKILEVSEYYDVDEIIIAMPSVEKSKIKEIINICKETGCELKILPGIYQLVNEDVSINDLRKVELEDLLGRDKVNISCEDILTEISGKTILVTGGGGSIGSEICRQVAQYNPKQLIIVDIYENSVYELQQELQKTFPKLNLKVLIASVRNDHRINIIFKEYKPDLVYHAAAHKHVPLMEESPNEAIKNNVLGTLNVVKAAGEYNASKFVLISTDKAVNPTNIMGASKHICEMIIQTYNNKYKTEFCAVRFGNVLGSNGSVVPFLKNK